MRRELLGIKLSSGSGVGGEVFVSSWSLAKVGKDDVPAGGNDRVAWSCRNGREDFGMDC